MMNKPHQEVTRLAKWMINLETASSRPIQEGVCDECGAYDAVFATGDGYVCSICRKNLINAKKTKKDSV
jgi:hypothetical protein